MNNINSPDESETPPKKVIFSSFGSFTINGKTIDNFNKLPSETQDKLRDALSKIEQNPTLLNQAGLAKDLLQKMFEQMSVGNMPNKTTIEVDQPTDLIPSSNSLNPQDDEQKYAPDTINNTPKQFTFSTSAKFNPSVKTDSLRHAIIIIALTAIICYLVFKYAWHGQLPF